MYFVSLKGTHTKHMHVTTYRRPTRHLPAKACSRARYLGECVSLDDIAYPIYARILWWAAGSAPAAEVVWLRVAHVTNFLHTTSIPSFDPLGLKSAWDRLENLPEVATFAIFLKSYFR